MIIYLKVRIIDTETGTESEFYADEFETDYEDNLDSKVTCNKSLLLGPRSAKQHDPVLPDSNPAKHHVPEDTTRMIEFDMIRSRSPANLISAIVN